MKSVALKISARFSIQSAFVAITVIAVAFSLIFIPRFRDSQSQKLFSSKGAVVGSTVDLHEPSLLDRLLLFPGFVQQVNLDGGDERLGEQVGALSSFQYLTHMNAVAVEEELEVSKEMPRLSKVAFSFCDKDFVRVILKNSPKLREISIFECVSVDDQALAVIEHNFSLETIQIDGSSASGTFGASLERLPLLRKLAIRNSPITNQGLEALGKLGDLEYLEVMQMSIDLDPLMLQNLRSLEQLELVNFIDDDLAIQRLSQALPDTAISVDGENVAAVGANVE